MYGLILMSVLMDSNMDFWIGNLMMLVYD